jgi:hypothetical protein
MQGEQVGETVGGRDAAVERTRMYSPRVSTACSPRQLKERANHHHRCPYDQTGVYPCKKTY